MLPQLFGRGKSHHERFRHWSRRGVFRSLFERVRQLDDKTVLRHLDAAYVKCSIGSLTGRCSEKQRVVGRTKGGFTSKITAIGDGRRRIHEYRVDPGNESDHTMARKIALPPPGKKLVADRGFSSLAFRQRLENAKLSHCIKQKSNEKVRHAFNKQHYRHRHHIENAFAGMRRWCRLELRRERRPECFEVFVALWASSTWIAF